jgi:dihydrolipoamide dehydrogenase
VADGSGRIIGAHVIAPGASDMIAELTLAVGRSLTLEDIASVIYAHPSLSEGFGEAALKANGEALHILNG